MRSETPTRARCVLLRERPQLCLDLGDLPIEELDAFDGQTRVTHQRTLAPVAERIHTQGGGEVLECGGAHQFRRGVRELPVGAQGGEYAAAPPANMV